MHAVDVQLDDAARAELAASFPAVHVG
jgi:hypothetical protein